eukprot:CAMPEP_0114255988 /NCGR_PEP_ID=MMETSP0058-20121206/17886_1 /TAXON_ID=36894 /ORGANISM="Pyramimonas parkeae, CCMP726" /LENGTH=323 /DNA_ID=CAMNT_0001370471 /DNA_START=93 /DNA_END=1064 /DNA_ORIENTATION=-
MPSFLLIVTFGFQYALAQFEIGLRDHGAALQASLKEHSNSTLENTALQDGECRVLPEHLAHTLHKIRTAKVNYNPYAHLYIHEIFHPDLYRCMLSRLPRTISPYKQLMKNVQRYYIQLREQGVVGPCHSVVEAKAGFDKREASFRKIPTNHPGVDVPFWTKWAHDFGSDAIKVTYLNKFADTLQLRVPNATGYTNALYFNIMMFRDQGGLNIGPHTDVNNKWVTILYYLPKDLSVRRYGTNVYRSRSGRTQESSSKWYDAKDKDFSVVEHADFVPNSVFAFAPCFSSWHAVPRTRPGDRRDTVQAFIITPKAVDVPKAECISR